MLDCWWCSQSNHHLGLVGPSLCYSCEVVGAAESREQGTVLEDGEGGLAEN